MRWFTLLSGVFVVAYLGAAAVDQYWSGVAFTKSWWPVMLVPVFLIALLGLVVGCVWLLVSVNRRKTKPSWLLVLVFPLLCVGIQFIPMPGFVEGMAHRVQRDFDANEIHRFAEQARALKVDWSQSSSDEEKGLEALKHALPEIMSLSKIEPRVTLASSHVDILYGSALVKHWGVRVVDRPDKADPFASEQDADFLEALPGVWVYQLPY